MMGLRVSVWWMVVFQFQSLVVVPALSMRVFSMLGDLKALGSGYNCISMITINLCDIIIIIDQ